MPSRRSRSAPPSGSGRWRGCAYTPVGTRVPWPASRSPTCVDSESCDGVREAREPDPQDSERSTTRRIEEEGMARRALVSAALALTALAAVAQDYPNRPIRLIQGFPPGGNADVVARILGQEMSRGLGQPIVVEVRPGAGGNIAAEAVAKAPPDG